LQAGVNAKIVSERLGHHSVAFTLDTYAHVMPAMQSEAGRRLSALIDDPDREHDAAQDGM
jgi:integrase